MESEFVRQNLTRSSVVYLIDKKWSEQYTAFLKKQNAITMQPIDNSRLLDSKGELKPNLKQRQDYFVVTQKIWKFVHAFYGGGPCIAKDSTFPVVSLSNKKVYLPPVGIQNPLNLCYMISVMQILVSIEHFNGYILRKHYVENGGDTKKRLMHQACFKLLKQYSDCANSKQQKFVQIKEFASLFQNRFNQKQQHDVHQFFLYFLQLLQDELKTNISLVKPQQTSQALYSQYFRQNRSIIDKVFAGQQQTVVNCHSCNSKSNTYVPFLQLVLQIQGMNTLQQCLDRYFQPQKLQDLYDCEKCHKKANAQKSTYITKCPNYLLIVLGKFSPTSFKKLEDKIQYDLDISMKKYSQGHCGETNYTLHSLIIHKGSKSNKGHYYTMTRRGANNTWLLLNDKNVKQIDVKDVTGRDPYILVYERVKVWA